MTEATTLDIGNTCVWCGDDTDLGSGKFVNRIPVYADISNTTYAESMTLPAKYTHIEGFGCEACYEEEI